MQETEEQELPVLVVDLGGTKIITAIISHKGEVIARHYRPTLASEGPRLVIERMLSGIDCLLAQSNISLSQLSAISIAAAGVIDIKKGVITESPHLPGWRNVPWKSIVEEKYKVTTFHWAPVLVVGLSSMVSCI